MPIPDSEALLGYIKSGDIKRVVSDHILGGDIWLFLNSPNDREPFYAFLEDKLEISRENIYVVGSAKLGYSCAPHEYGRRFNRDSDIDIAIVSDVLFDKYWHNMLDWSYAKRGTIDRDEKNKISEYRKTIMKGFVNPHYKYPHDFPRDQFNERVFRVKWQSALRGMSSLTGTTEIHLHDVKARLYRTKEHALMYHFDGLRILL